MNDHVKMSFGTYTERTKELATRRGFTDVDVLAFLIGRPLDDVVFAWIHSLRPSSVRVCRGGQNDDARCWRVTIHLNADDTVRSIHQEVEVALPEGFRFGHDMVVDKHRWSTGDRRHVAHPSKMAWRETAPQKPEGNVTAEGSVAPVGLVMQNVFDGVKLIGFHCDDNVKPRKT